MKSLLDKLQQYAGEDYYPMHMPGHKRNCMIMHPFNPVAVDITEIDGFDNLHHANGILKSLMERVKELYHSDASYLLINGSTVGLLAGISACVKKGDKILVARNCHKAVYNAILLNELDPVYLYPPMDGRYGISGGILPEDVERMLKNDPEIRLVVLTSPTYEGIVSDVAAIAEICHRYQVPILVDEAHGAHFGFDEEFPDNSIAAGADVVIHSIHKTLPAFTQTALLHVNGTLVNPAKIERALGIYETSSPSYILMSGMDECMKILKNQSKELFPQLKSRLDTFLRQMEALKHLQVMRARDYSQRENGILTVDPSKLVISVKNTKITGSELAQILLHHYKIQLEMSTPTYALAMTSICDTQEGFDRLAQALLEIDDSLESKEETQTSLNPEEEATSVAPIPVKRKKPCEVMEAEIEAVTLEKSIGRIGASYVCVYPPGTPVIVPGEEIAPAQIEYLERAKQCGLELMGMTDEDRLIPVTID